MKHKKLERSAIFQFLFMLCVIMFGTGCEDDDQPIVYHATGEIILITGMCYGEAIIIEVDNTERIGDEGSYTFAGDTIKYQNAISVPYFSKTIEIPDSIVPEVGLRLDFECRELEKDEASLFMPTNLAALLCPAKIIPPSAKPYIITKINNP